MEIQVKIVELLPVQRFTSQKNGNEYVRNVFVGETHGQYPKKIAFTVMGEDKFRRMDIVVGSSYNLSFDIESREWKGKWFTECQSWKAICLDGSQSSSNAPAGRVQDVVANGAPADDGDPF